MLYSLRWREKLKSRTSCIRENSKRGTKDFLVEIYSNDAHVRINDAKRLVLRTQSGDFQNLFSESFK